MNAMHRHREWQAPKFTDEAIGDLLQCTGQTLGNVRCGKPQNIGQGARFEVVQETIIKNLLSFVDL
jgi:hypothetical protein